MTEKKEKIVRYGCCYVLIAMLCWLFPYTGDDWAWGSQIGIDRLHTWFANYNGRYLGNLCVLVMTRSNLIKSLVMAFCLTGILVLMEKITCKKNMFYIGCVVLVMMPKFIFRQAVVWTAGFSNYVTSLFLTMVFIAYIYPVLKSGKVQYKNWHCIFMLLLGISNTLFVEHMTIYNLVVAIVVVGYCCIRYKRIYASFVAYAIGAFAGTTYMFSNEAYHTIANNQDGYRQMAKGGVLVRAFTNYKDIIVKNLFINSIWINLAILAVCMLLGYQYFIKKQAHKRMVQVAKISIGIMLVYNVWAILSSLGLSIYAKQERFLYMEMLLASVYMMALFIYSLIIGYQQGNIWNLLFWNLSIICVAAPLLVVNPIGERCFFVTYIFFAMLFLELLGALKLEGVVSFLKGKMLRNICICFAMAGLAFYINIFSSISQVDHDRLARVRSQVEKGATSVEIIHLPYESYLWTSTPEAEPWIERYKLFYGLPKDLELKDVWSYSK